MHDVKVAKADTFKMSMEINLILDGSVEHVSALLALVNLGVERKVT